MSFISHFWVQLSSSNSRSQLGSRTQTRQEVGMPPPPHSTDPSPSMPPSSSQLYKQNSWSPDLHRDEEWKRRKGKHHHRRRRKSKSVTDEDIDELKACIELGFGFNNSSPESDDRLSSTLPALGFYHAVNKQYHDTISKSSPMSTSSSSSISHASAVPEPELSSPSSSSHTIINRGNSSTLISFNSDVSIESYFGSETMTFSI